MRAVALAVFARAAFLLLAAPLPPLRYAFTSFATAAPDEAAAFLIKYFGAVLLDPSDYLTHRNASSAATIRGLRFFYGGAASHDVYFASDPTKRAAGMDAATFAEHLNAVHRFDTQETWDWWQDWHLCFHADEPDRVLARLLRDKVPVVTRSSYSFYVEAPHGLTIQVLGPSMSLAWSENFNFCRFTVFPPAAGPEQPLALGQLPDPLPELPELSPAHHSFFSTTPTAALNYSLTYLGGEPYDMSGVWADSHRYGDGRCALLRWLQLPGYQLHFVQQLRKTEGPLLTVPGIEGYLTSLHGSLTEQDSFFDDRVAFRVADVAPFAARLEAGQEPYLRTSDHTGESLFLQLPGGIIVQLLSPSQEYI